MTTFFINNPTFSENGPTWINIVATDGMTFNEVRLVGNGFRWRSRTWTTSRGRLCRPRRRPCWVLAAW